MQFQPADAHIYPSTCHICVHFSSYVIACILATTFLSRHQLAQWPSTDDLACTCPHQDHGATVCTESLTNIIQSSFRWQQDITNTMASNPAGFLLWGARIRHTWSPHISSCCCQTQLPCGQQCQCQHIRWSQSQSAIALGHGSQPQHLYKTHRLGCRGCNWLWSCCSLTYTFSSSPAPALLQHAQTPSQTCLASLYLRMKLNQVWATLVWAWTEAWTFTSLLLLHSTPMWVVESRRDSQEIFGIHIQTGVDAGYS